MANNKSTEGESVCEKFYKAIWHVSPNSENPNQKTPKSQAVSSEVPVVFNTPLPTTTIGRVSKVSLEAEPVIKKGVLSTYKNVSDAVVKAEKTKPKVETVSQIKPLGNKNVDGDDFSNYINRSKAKIRTTSSIGGGRERESLARLDSLDHKVGDYIKRTKMKIRAMSGIGGGRALSIK